MALPKNDINTTLSVDGLQLRTKPDGTVIGKVTVEQSVPTPTGGGSLVIAYDDATGEFDKTWQEVDDALAEGMYVVMVKEDNDGHWTLPVASTFTSEGLYYCIDRNNTVYVCDSADGYPTYSEDDNEPVV